MGISCGEYSDSADSSILQRFRWAAILSTVVLLECCVLAVNGGSCPLTDLAARYTLDRGPNFDIYLPDSLAEHNKVIFGSIFVFGELVFLWCWTSSAVKQILKAGALYFTLVFTVGFILGAIRTLWVVPILGTRTAELIEEPIMLGVSIITARQVVRWLRFPPVLARLFRYGTISYHGAFVGLSSLSGVQALRVDPKDWRRLRRTAMRRLTRPCRRGQN